MSPQRRARVKKRQKLAAAANDALDVDADDVIEVEDGFSSDDAPSPPAHAKHAVRATRALSKPTGARDTARPSARPHAALWADAHEPTSAPALVMSTVTVNKVRRWMTAAIAGVVPNHPRMLILTGPPGAGKSTAVHILGAELGAEIAEWHAPLPNDTEVATSRTLLDSMHAFLVGVRYPSLLRASPSRRVLLVDDVPLSLYDSQKTRERSQEFRDILQTVASFSPNPAVVVLSDSSKARAKAARVVGLDLFDSPNVQVVNVKQATEASMARVLEAVTKRENRRLLSDSLNALIATSQGDIRSALNCLHLYCTSAGSDHAVSGGGVDPETELAPRAALSRKQTSSRSSGTQKRSRSSSRHGTRTALDHVAGVGGDASLDTYHAVSKVLNNKKDFCGASKYNPEQILTDARTEPVAFMAFLHQNYPQFFSCAEDAAEALELLSESENLTTWRQGDSLRTYLGECAASVVTRGFLISNRAPIRSGWRPVHGTEEFAVKKQAFDTVRRARSSLDVERSDCSRPARSLATDLVPYCELIRLRTSSGATRRSGRTDFRYTYPGRSSSHNRFHASRAWAGIDSADLAMLSEEEAAGDGIPVPSIDNSSSEHVVRSRGARGGNVGDYLGSGDEIEDFLSD